MPPKPTTKLGTNSKGSSDTKKRSKHSENQSFDDDEEEGEGDDDDLEEDDDDDDDDDVDEDFEEEEIAGVGGAAESKEGENGGSQDISSTSLGIKSKKTLFMKHLPENTTVEQIKALSSDILDVRLDVSHFKSDKTTKYAILDFADGEAAARTLDLLRGQPINGASVIVDFIGGRTMVTHPAVIASSDLLKLYTTGFGRDISVDQLKAMFPTASDITLPLNPNDNNKPVGYAFIHYENENVCRAAHDSMQDFVYQGRTLVVMYGKKSNPARTAAAAAGSKRKPPAGSRGRGRPKKSKVEEEEEEDTDSE